MGKKFDYRQAEDDLHQSGCHYSDEVYAYRSEKDLRQFMKENGLDADKYFKDTGNTGGILSTAPIDVQIVNGTDRSRHIA